MHRFFFFCVECNADKRGREGKQLSSRRRNIFSKVRLTTTLTYVISTINHGRGNLLLVTEASVITQLKLCKSHTLNVRESRSIKINRYSVAK